MNSARANKWVKVRFYPQAAAIALTMNTVNNAGNFDPKKADKYRRDMADGDWNPYKHRSDPVSFKHGRMTNGQHRMAALVTQPKDFYIELLVDGIPKQLEGKVHLC